jgi:hypothetical protein
LSSKQFLPVGNGKISVLPNISKTLTHPLDIGVVFSVADPGCLNRIQQQQLKRGVKKISCHTFFCSHKFHKIENYFILGMLKKKIWANFQRIIEHFIQKIVTKLSKMSLPCLIQPVLRKQDR